MVTTAGSRAGLTLAVLSAATFGTSGAFASSLIGAGWSPAAAVLTRIVVAALLLVVPAVLPLPGRLVFRAVGRDVRRRRRPRRAWLGRCAAPDRHHRQGRLHRPPGQLGRAGPGAVSGGGGAGLRRGHRRRPTARRQARLVRRHERSAVRDL